MTQIDADTSHVANESGVGLACGATRIDEYSDGPAGRRPYNHRSFDLGSRRRQVKGRLRGDSSCPWVGPTQRLHVFSRTTGSDHAALDRCPDSCRCFCPWRCPRACRCPGRCRW